MSIVGTKRNGLAAGRAKSDLIMLTQLANSPSRPPTLWLTIDENEAETLKLSTGLEDSHRHAHLLSNYREVHAR